MRPDLRHSQSVGRGLGAAAGRARLRGAGDDQRGPRLYAGPARWRRRRQPRRRRWPTRSPSSRRPTCRSRPIWRTASATRRRTCAETIRAASAVGLAGGSIEDATGDRRAADLRFRAGGRARRRRGRGGAGPAGPVRADGAGGEFPARPAGPRRHHQAACRPSRRPAPRCSMPRRSPSLEQIRAVCGSVSRPVNVVMGLVGGTFSVQQLAEAGREADQPRLVAGADRARRAACGRREEIRDYGTFCFADGGDSLCARSTG